MNFRVAVSLMVVFSLLHCQQAVAAYVDVILADRPIAYWRLNEAAGARAVNLGSLGPAANGLYLWRLTRRQPGLLAKDPDPAVLFAGGWVQTFHVDGINRKGPFDKKTIELWFKADKVTGRQVLFEQGDKNRGLSLYLDGDTIYVVGYNKKKDAGGVASPWGVPPIYVASSTSIRVGLTYYVALVMDGSPSGTTGTITGYLNGTSFGQTSGVGLLYDHSPATVGRVVSETRFHTNQVHKSGAPFFGVIDEVALYNEALTDTQLQNHYQAGLGRPGGVSGVRILQWEEIAQ